MKKNRPKGEFACCDWFKEHFYEYEDEIFVYHPCFRRYGVKVPERLGGGTITIFHCPWCGAKLPENLGDKWFEEVEKALGTDDFEPRNAPKEFKSDEWWKKRGL
jgi:hypothetical protein